MKQTTNFAKKNRFNKTNFDRINVGFRIRYLGLNVENPIEYSKQGSNLLSNQNRSLAREEYLLAAMARYITIQRQRSSISRTETLCHPPPTGYCSVHPTNQWSSARKLTSLSVLRSYGPIARSCSRSCRKILNDVN